ncbi:MAG: FliM/FliN family flagellar motor switch protein [Terriglobales bacterium]
MGDKEQAAGAAGAAADAAAAAPKDGPALPQRGYMEVWADAALEVVRGLSGDEGWKKEEAPAALPTEVLDMVAHLELSGALGGSQQIKLTRRAARAWARLVLSPPAADAESDAALDESERDALGEVIRRLLTVAAAGLKAAGWGEVTFQLVHVGPLRRLVESKERSRPLLYRNSGGAALELELALEASLRERLRQRMNPSAYPMPLPEPSSNAHNTAKLDLLLDVELDVTLRFGGRQMLLHDVVDLSPGSVLELDRHIDDPVELLVGGKTIAWGDVVVVDGNYGLRVNRMVHRRERMAALEAAR